jgi:hypothetical protein
MWLLYVHVLKQLQVTWSLMTCHVSSTAASYCRANAWLPTRGAPKVYTLTCTQQATAHSIDRQDSLCDLPQTAAAADRISSTSGCSRLPTHDEQYTTAGGSKRQAVQQKYPPAWFFKFVSTCLSGSSSPLYFLSKSYAASVATAPPREWPASMETRSQCIMLTHAAQQSDVPWAPAETDSCSARFWQSKVAC